MHRYLLFLAVVLVSLSCKQTNNHYIIKGKLNGKVPSKVYLQKRVNGNLINFDSAMVVLNDFKFKGTVENCEMVNLKIDDNNTLPFFIENSAININGHIDSLDNVEITGSQSHLTYLNYNKLVEPYNNIVDSIYILYKNCNNEQTLVNYENQMDSIENIKTDLTKSFIVQNNTSVVSAYIINRYLLYNLGLNGLVEHANLLEPNLLSSQYTQNILKRIDILRTLEPGMPAPLFVQTDTNGNNISINSYKGKYLLIDFWASWCPPCRKANPQLVKLYNKYRYKNFDILGVSLDKDKKAWTNAIKADALAWQQVSELNAWNNSAAKLYGVNSIPHAILIGPDGNIIKRGIKPAELDQLLQTLLLKNKIAKINNPASLQQ